MSEGKEPVARPPVFVDRAPLYAMGGMLLALILAPIAWRGWLPVPPCFLRTVVGIPCPFCGATRSLVAISSMHWEQALRLNPLVVMLCALVVVWMFFWLVERAMGGSWLTAFVTNARAKISWRVVLALVLMNWLFVLWMKVV